MTRLVVTTCCAVCALCSGAGASAAEAPSANTASASGAVPPSAAAGSEVTSAREVKLLFVGGATKGAHTQGVASGLELGYRAGLVQAVALGQVSSELFGGGSDQRLAVGVGPALRFGNLELSVAAIGGFATYVIRESCLVFCDEDRPSQRGRSSFGGGHGAWHYVFPLETGGVLIGMSGNIIHDLSRVASQPAGWQYTTLLNAGASFDL